MKVKFSLHKNYRRQLYIPDNFYGVSVNQLIAPVNFYVIWSINQGTFEKKYRPTESVIEGELRPKRHEQEKQSAPE